MTAGLDANGNPTARHHDVARGRAWTPLVLRQWAPGRQLRGVGRRLGRGGYTRAHVSAYWTPWQRLEQAGVDWIEIKCRTCPRAGPYWVLTLIERSGRASEDWIDQISADCPKRVETRDWCDFEQIVW